MTRKVMQAKKIHVAIRLGVVMALLAQGNYVHGNPVAAQQAEVPSDNGPTAINEENKDSQPQATSAGLDALETTSDNTASDKTAEPALPDSSIESLESLMNVEVTSVSRKAEAFSDAPAALTVISQEDIERSGFTNLPEVLRLVPGIHVARISSHKWSISARGFSNEFANKLLVLVDGRTAYNPAFSGVYWDDQDLMLEDIERIEVIRGPGATIWGANAVNGVINIITKNARSTQGTLLTGRLGSQEKIAGVRFGAKMGEKSFGRFYFKESRYDAFPDLSGKSSGDSWRGQRAGFRIDTEKNERDSWTLQGDLSKNSENDFFSTTSLAPPYVSFVKGKFETKTSNLLGRWTRILGKDSDMSLQMYFDHSQRKSPLIEEHVRQFDIDFNHHFRLNPRHDIVWGLGFRRSKVDFGNTFTISINTPKKNSNLYSAFVQDDITLKEDKLRLILGTKLEHNSFTGFEIQPNARMVWTPDSKQTIWGAISRAVHTPSHSELGLRVNAAAFPNPMPGPPVIVITNFGNPNLRSEELVAHEIGYRVQPNSKFILDATAFYNKYDKLITNVFADPFFEADPMPPHLVIPGYFANTLGGTTYGVEIAPTWKVNNRWKLSGSYSWYKANLKSSQPNNENGIGFPQHMVQLRSSYDLRRDLTFDVFASYTSPFRFPTRIPGFSRLDMRIGWKPSDDLSLSLGVQNLGSPSHMEAVTFADIQREVPRSFYVQGSWKF